MAVLGESDRNLEQPGFQASEDIYTLWQQFIYYGLLRCLIFDYKGACLVFALKKRYFGAARGDPIPEV